MNGALAVRTESDSLLFHSRGISYDLDVYEDGGASTENLYLALANERFLLSCRSVDALSGMTLIPRLPIHRTLGLSFDEIYDTVSVISDSITKNFHHESKSLPNSEALSIFEVNLSKHCSERLAMLFNCPEGWDGDNAKTLSYNSLLLSLQLLGRLSLKKQGDKASVFMDHDGYISIAWPTDEDENMIEIFFRPNEINVYTDVDDEDVFFANVSDGLIQHIARYM
ncbi:hypothetical protein EKK97_22200 [Billgrantia tianxiuensis]|jgi:hypothetical protein|uniref:Uncharacterized protein n=1 Tax=Billgrantia tianxiuensis TaxID=2497861 RepID=A0A6I6SPG9_9GAMM|nr:MULTISPECIES: hypothetical protein [Halomonas]MCE8035908.1 hypothetical protein [Halomonas sp. MCCC 1A11057]QHC51772.1 hypothetical protein EKK97_22200 [Halomonas tianxiuensis]